MLFRSWINPEDALTIGTLNEGAELHGFVAAVEVIVPDVTEIRPDDTFTVWAEDMMTVAVPEICTSPEDADTMGMLKPGALDHGFVAAVAVTVGVPEI